MKLVTRPCTFPKCTATFRCLPTSMQTGCCRDHDARGIKYRRELVQRRKKRRKGAEFDLETGVVLEDVTDELEGEGQSEDDGGG